MKATEAEQKQNLNENNKNKHTTEVECKEHKLNKNTHNRS